MPAEVSQAVRLIARTAWLSCFLVVLCACSPPAEDGMTQAEEIRQEKLFAEFEWFEYEGNDPVFETEISAQEYRNPIIAGFYPDPSVVRVGEDFYLVNSTFGFYPGIPVFHSRDLVNWTQVGNVIDRPDMMDFEGVHLSQQGLYAPTIEFHDGLFYMANTCVACGGNFLVTASNPAGPWSDPVWLPEIGGIDPSLFFEDGHVFILNHGHPEGPELYDGHRAIWITEVNPVNFLAISKPKMLVDGGVNIDDKPIYVEGPHLYNVDGAYFLSAAEGGTEMGHSQVIFKSDDIWGPYLPWDNNPILTQRTLPVDRPNPVNSTGHADLFTDPAGNCWSVFLGTRTYDTVHFNTGRETFLLPCQWQDGWPVILGHGETVPYTVARPSLPQASGPEKPTSGNFRIRETFNSTLTNDWLFARIPASDWWSAGGGKLTMEARSERIGDMAQPSLIARRLQHMNMTATSALRFTPREHGDEAGMVAIQNDAYYFTFGVGQDQEGASVLRLRQRSGENDPLRGRVLTEELLDLESGQQVFLRIEVNADTARFSWSRDGETFITVHDAVDARTLSSARAGGFVGALVGMYAESDTLQ